jgi:hypothetical protein
MRCSEYVSVPVRRAAVARLASMPMSMDSCRIRRDYNPAQARQGRSPDHVSRGQKHSTSPQHDRPPPAASEQADEVCIAEPVVGTPNQETQATWQLEPRLKSVPARRNGQCPDTARICQISSPMMVPALFRYTAHPCLLPCAHSARCRIESSAGTGTRVPRTALLVGSDYSTNDRVRQSICRPLAAANCCAVTGPARKIAGGVTVRSSTVDATPPRQVPPSRMRGINP